MAPIAARPSAPAAPKPLPPPAPVEKLAQVTAPAAASTPAAETPAPAPPSTAPSAAHRSSGAHAHRHPRPVHHPEVKAVTHEVVKPKAEAPLVGDGTLLIATSPWCNVRVDGADKGPTPLTLKLPAGRHTVVLTNSEFKINRTLPVTILPNQTVRKRLDFGQ